MKQTVFGMVSVMLLTLFLLILMTVYGRHLRQTETDHTLSEAVDTTMSNLLEQQLYTIESGDEFVADFLQSLLVQMNSTSDVKVSVLAADEEKGILSVEVTETYKHPNGKEGSVSAVRTVILDKSVEVEKKQYTVAFYTENQELYKQYLLPEGSTCSLPVVPEIEGKTFRCWQFVTGGNGEAGSVEIVDTGETKKVLTSGGIPYRVAGDTKLMAVFE